MTGMDSHPTLVELVNRLTARCKRLEDENATLLERLEEATNGDNT